MSHEAGLDCLTSGLCLGWETGKGLPAFPASDLGVPRQGSHGAWQRQRVPDSPSVTPELAPTLSPSKARVHSCNPHNTFKERNSGGKQGRDSYLTGVFAVPSLGATLGPAALGCTSGQEAGLGKAGVCTLTGYMEGTEEAGVASTAPGKGEEMNENTPMRSHPQGWGCWLTARTAVSALLPHLTLISLRRGFWERLPLPDCGPQGWRSGQSQEPSPHPPRACHQKKDDPPVSETSFDLQLGANPIAGSNLILH